MEVSGSYHFLSDYSGGRGTIPDTLTRTPDSKSQNLDVALNFFMNLKNSVVLRVGGLYHQPLSFTETATNAGGQAYYTASVNMWALGGQAGLDLVPYKTKWLRIYAGGFVGMFFLGKITTDYVFEAAGIADGNSHHKEKLSAGSSLFWEAHGGAEFAVFDRLSLCLEGGYFKSTLGGWTAGEAFTGFGRSVAAGAEFASKSERLGGLFGRLVLRTYF